MRIIDTLRGLDWVITGAALLLVLIGLAMFISATYTDGFISPLFIRQGIAALVGLSLFLLVARIPYHVWRRYALAVYILGLTLLGLVTLLGSTIRGTISRLEIAGFQIQPSEYMKIGLVLLLAWLLARYDRFRWRQLLVSLMIILPPVVLVLREPDFGVAALMLATWGGLLLVLGLRFRYILSLSFIALIAMAISWQFLLFDYQKARILTFVDPAHDPRGAGYNVTQSLIAFGSGQFFGRGLGHGPQSQLKFLPERHTDFIFASIGEELGFIGVVIVITLYTVILYRLYKLATVTEDRFGRILSIGIFLLLLASFTVSAGMNMGLLPITGIPMPLVSYGGSNLVVTFILLGLIQSIHLNNHFVRRGPAELTYLT